jgi:hypothetical protein
MDKITISLYEIGKLFIWESKNFLQPGNVTPMGGIAKAGETLGNPFPSAQICKFFHDSRY